MLNRRRLTSRRKKGLSFGLSGRVVIAAFVLCFCFVGFAQASENLVKNGDAETGTLDNWKGFDSVVSDEAHSGKHCFMKAGYEKILSKELIPIDTAKAYKLTGWFKSKGKTKSNIHFGYVPYDAEKTLIHPVNVACGRYTETVLAADCSASDTVVKITNGSRWFLYAGAVIAFDVDDSGEFTDLPNRNISSPGVINVVNKGHYWDVHLQGKCGQAYPAGTKVREHGSGMTHIYNAAANEIAPTESWTQYAGVIKGREKSRVSSNRWWPGTAYVRILILANYQQNKEVQVLVDDIVMTEVKTELP